MLGYINRLFFLHIIFCVLTPVRAQDQDTIQKIDLENVIVKSARINVNNKQVPFSVSIKNFNKDVNYSQKSSLIDFTNSIPGLYVSSSNNFSQDLRNDHISIGEAKLLIKKYDGEFPKRYFNDVMNYLDIEPNFFLKHTDKFRSPHLWKKIGKNWKLRHTPY